MDMPDEERNRSLKKKHQQLLREWKKNNGPCIICGEEHGNEQDHLPPKVLYPKKLRNDKTYFFSFPVCSNCNRGSSDEDFLFSVLLSIGLNQKSYLENQKPTDPDLLALDEQAQGHFQDSTIAEYRKKLLQNYIGKHPLNGRVAINKEELQKNRTVTKIVKSIYWLHTGGDILQRYNPGWWIRPVDPSKESFIEKHLKVTHAEIQWEDKFIYYYSIGQPDSGADGYITCSLHFYSKKSVHEGMSWLLTASPVNTKINVSLYELCKLSLGGATIAPRD